MNIFAGAFRAPAFWWRGPGLASRLLTPFAAIYGGIAARRLAGEGIRAQVPVVCVGNPSLGGSGKTPTVIALAGLLLELGKHPFLLTRGYGGRVRVPTSVDPVRHTASEVGDEALLLARVAPTIVSADRPAAAKVATAAGADVLLLDDGFQNPALAKDFSFLVIDGRVGFGNCRVFPAGPLRAPLKPQLERAHALVIVGPGAPGDEIAMLAAELQIPVIRARLVPDPVTGARLAGKRVLAFAGIGAPDKFFATLTELGAQLAERCPFPDHHVYSATDAQRLIRRARADGLILVTTEKDWMRIKADTSLGELIGHTLALSVSLKFEDPGFVKNLMAEALEPMRHQPAARPA